MAKFAVGEIAIWATTPSNELYFGRLAVGDEVEVVRVGVSPGVVLLGPGILGGEGVTAFVGAQYECRHPSGYHFCCDEENLRKRPQRGIPESVLRLFEAPIKRGQSA